MASPYRLYDLWFTKTVLQRSGQPIPPELKEVIKGIIATMDRAEVEKIKKQAAAAADTSKPADFEPRVL